MKIQSSMPKVPFVPSSEESVKKMVELTGVKRGQKVADLGCGDGRVVVAFAKAGAEAHGYEIDSDLIIKAEASILDQRLDNKAFIHFGDFWQQDLSPYDIVAIYGLSSIMGNLEEKLKKELKPGTKVVSNVFTFPTWAPKKKKDNIYLYIIP